MKDLTVEEKAELLDWYEENWREEVLPDELKDWEDGTVNGRIFRLMTDDHEEKLTSAIRRVRGLEYSIQFGYVQSWVDAYA